MLGGSTLPQASRRITAREMKGFREAKASVGSDLRHDVEPTVIKGCYHGRFAKATVSPPPSCYQLFSVEARAKSLCVRVCLLTVTGWEEMRLSLGGIHVVVAGCTGVNLRMCVLRGM